MRTKLVAFSNSLQPGYAAADVPDQAQPGGSQLSMAPSVGGHWDETRQGVDCGCCTNFGKGPQR